MDFPNVRRDLTSDWANPVILLTRCRVHSYINTLSLIQRKHTDGNVNGSLHGIILPSGWLITLQYIENTCVLPPQSSSQRHGEHRTLPLPGSYLRHDGTLAGRGPPSLSGFRLRSGGSHHRLPVRSACTDPICGLHPGPGPLCLHGCADPDHRGSARVNVIHELWLCNIICRMTPQLGFGVQCHFFYYCFLI